MVRTVTVEAQAGKAIKHKPPLIVELVGPAGAGKTTLAQALTKRDERVVIGADIELRKMEHIPIFLGYAPFFLLPVFLRRGRASRWFTWDEIKAMVYLKGWPQVLKQQAMHDGAAILLDHGPIFKLATLMAFGPERLESQGFEKWWRSMFEQWAATLDLVIWLNAPDSILLQRINKRNQRHAVKGKPESEAFKFLARYRTSYDQVFAQLEEYGRPTLRQFDTTQESVEEIVDEVLRAVGTVGCNTWQ